MLGAALIAMSGEAMPDCPKQADAALMRLDYGAFDTAPGPVAWRNLLDRGCVDSAVQTLKSYRSANRTRLTPEQMDEMSFHMGQALAFAGREGESIAYFEGAAGKTSSATWSAYVEATIGFLTKDQHRLERALADYEKEAKPGSMRLALIRGLLKCFDRSYAEAAHCGM